MRSILPNVIRYSFISNLDANIFRSINCLLYFTYLVLTDKTMLMYMYAIILLLPATLFQQGFMNICIRNSKQSAKRCNVKSYWIIVNNYYVCIRMNHEYTLNLIVFIISPYNFQYYSLEFNDILKLQHSNILWKPDNTIRKLIELFEAESHS